MLNEVTRQGVRNLDLLKRKVEVAPCQMVDGKHVGGTLSKWKKEGIYPNAAFGHGDEPGPTFRAGTIEVRECLCCHRPMEERNREYDFEKAKSILSMP